MSYQIIITPKGTNERKIYGVYETSEQANDAMMTIPYAIRHSCHIQLWEVEK